jgi:autotransporter-associated beta strand protein
MNQKIAVIGILAASIAVAGAADYITDTVGTINGNERTVFEATGNSLDLATFSSDIATAFANNAGGVWDFEETYGPVTLGQTITLNYGVSQTNSLVLTMGGNTSSGLVGGISRDTQAGEATSGTGVLGFNDAVGNDGTFNVRTFTPDTPLLTVGIINTDRNQATRIPSLTVTYADSSTATTSGANANDWYFHALSGTLDNPIVSFSIVANNYVRWDDLGFIVAPEAEPEPSGELAVWNGLGANDNWSTGSNWESTLAPGYSGDMVTFAGSTRLTPVMENDYSVSGLTFDATAGSFHITAAPGKSLTLAGSGLTNSSFSAQTLDLPIILVGLRTVEDQYGAGVTLAGPVSGAGGLTISADYAFEILTLSGANSYTGATIVSPFNTLIVGNPAAIPSGSGKGNVTMNGTLDLNGNNVSVNGFTAGVVSVVDNTTANPVTLTLGNNDQVCVVNGVVQNSGGGALGLVKVGAGNLTLGGPNTYSGDTVISNGTVIANNAWAFGAGSLTLSGAALSPLPNGNNNLVYTTPIVIATGTTNVFGSPGANRDMYFAGPLSGGGRLSNFDGGAVSSQWSAQLYGDMSGFSGTIDYTAATNTCNFRLGDKNVSDGETFDLSQASVILRNGEYPNKNFGFSDGIQNCTLLIGELSGDGFFQGSFTPTLLPDCHLVIGYKNTSTTFSGSLGWSGSGYKTNFTLVKVGSGTLRAVGPNVYHGPTTVSNGVLVISTAFAGGGDFTVNDTKALGVTNSVAARSAEIGSLTLGDGAGPTTLTFDNVADTSTPVIVATGAVTRNGTCNIAVGASVLNTGGVYPLIKYGSLDGAGSFALTSVPSGVTATLTNDTSNQWIALHVSVGNGVNTTPTNITATASGGNLTLSWPADQTGWRLQVQTNALTTGLSTNWVTVPDSQLTNSMTIPTDAGNGSVFFRLVYP